MSKWTRATKPKRPLDELKAKRRQAELKAQQEYNQRRRAGPR